MANPATVVDTHGVVVRPVNQAAEVVPLVQAAKGNSIAQPQRNAPTYIEIIRDQQRLPPGGLQYETLVP